MMPSRPVEANRPVQPFHQHVLQRECPSSSEVSQHYTRGGKSAQQSNCLRRFAISGPITTHRTNYAGGSIVYLQDKTFDR
jgi:hypothetical protein